MLDTLTGWLNEDQTFLIKCLSPTKTGSKCTTARSCMQVNRVAWGMGEVQTFVLKKTKI